MEYEWLKSWEVVVSLMVAAFSGIAWIARYFDRRAKKRADDTKDEIRRDTRDVETRVAAVEKQIGDIDSDLERLSASVEDLQRTMSGVARAENVTDLRVSVATLEATLRAVGGKVDTMYRAAIDAGVNRAKS